MMAFSKWKEPKTDRAFWTVIAAVPILLVVGLFVLAFILKYLP